MRLGSNTFPCWLIHELMNRFRMIVLPLIGLVLAACTAAPPIPTATLLPSPTSAPTATQPSTPTASLTPTLVPLPPGAEILFEQGDGKDLAGTTYGQGQTAIILANMSVGDETQWSPFVAAVDKEKFTTVTFNYRSMKNAELDTSIVLQKLRESGYKRMICIGASLGVWSCGNIAHEPEIVGIVLIAGALKHKLADVTYPKLFMAGALDDDAFYTQMNYDQAPEPKKLVLFEGNNIHGTGLFASKDRDQFLTLLTDFVNGLASP
jgi:hypothetical protein